MKRIFLLTILTLLWVLAPVHAETFVSYSCVSSGCTPTPAVIDVIGLNNSTYVFSWYVTGTVTGCTVTVDSSSDGVTFQTGGLVGTQNCSASNSLTITNNSPNYIQVNPSTIVGSGTVQLVLHGVSTGGGGGGGGGGGVSPSSTHHVILTASTNAALIKASAGILTGGSVFNNTGSPFYVKVFNKATTPIPGTDVPQQTFAIQSGVTVPLDIPNGGLTFSAGIGIAVTANISDLDATPVAANAGTVDIFYQ